MKKIKYSEITPEKIYNNRRSFVKSIGFGAGSLTISSLPFLNNAIGNEQNKLTSFKEIYDEANQKLNIKDKSVFIEHAKGYLTLGEISIVIAVACKHRDEAYILSRYIIEEIKKRSPIWKKEHYNNKESTWLKGNPILHEKN